MVSHKTLEKRAKTQGLAHEIVQACGFLTLFDTVTEVTIESLRDAIPKLNELQPRICELYNGGVRKCFKNGLKNHNDVAKLLRRTLKMHKKALHYRRTSSTNRSSFYKFRIL